MKIEKFEDIIAWQKANSLCLIVYSIFSSCRDFGFKDQISRAAVSIMNNIAEGYERQTNKELKQFLFIAKGSSAEVRSMVYLAKNLKYINEKQYSEMADLSFEISRMLSGFIKTL